MAAATPDAGASGSQPRAPESPLWTKRVALMFFATLTVVFLVSIFYDPGDKDPYGKYSTICMFKNATTLPCPGCGLTHSFCEIGKGDFASAVAWNGVGIPLFGLAILVWLQSLFILRDWQAPARRLNRLAARARPLRLLAIAFVVYGVGRMVYILFFLRE